MPSGHTTSAPRLRGLITDADLASAEVEWPGLQEFLGDIPEGDRPPTFLQLVWMFETCRSGRRAA